MLTTVYAAAVAIGMLLGDARTQLLAVLLTGVLLARHLLLAHRRAQVPRLPAGRQPVSRR